MSFAYRDLLHFSDYFAILVCNDYCFSFYVIPTIKLMKKRRAYIWSLSRARIHTNYICSVRLICDLRATV